VPVGWWGTGDPSLSSGLGSWRAGESLRAFGGFHGSHVIRALECGERESRPAV